MTIGIAKAKTGGMPWARRMPVACCTLRSLYDLNRAKFALYQHGRVHRACESHRLFNAVRRIRKTRAAPPRIAPNARPRRFSSCGAIRLTLIAPFGHQARSVDSAAAARSQFKIEQPARMEPLCGVIRDGHGRNPVFRRAAYGLHKQIK